MRKDSNGKYIDCYSNTVEDAAAFENYFNYESPDNDSFYDYSEATEHIEVGDECQECYNGTVSFDGDTLVCGKCGIYFEAEEYEECGCSDPGCPCSGLKRGGAP